MTTGLGEQKSLTVFSTITVVHVFFKKIQLIYKFAESYACYAIEKVFL